MMVSISSGWGGAKQESSQEVFVIGVLYWSMNIPGQVAMRMGLEKEVIEINERASKEGLPRIRLTKLVAGDGEAGIQNQIEQMRSLIDQKVDLIVAQPTDNAALARPLVEANEAGIPVVAYDQYIRGGALAAYLTSDNYQAGYLDGEYVASAFDDEMEIKIVLVEYPHVSSTVERVDGFLDSLQDAGQPFRILKSYIAVEPKSGREAGQSMVRDFPEKGSIDVVFAVNDGGGLAVVEELIAASREEIFVASIDGDRASVDIIREGGPIKIDSAQFCGPLGAESIKAAYRILLGEDVPSHQLVPVFPVTQETLHLYHGWMGPIPSEFMKPWESHTPVWSNQLRAVTP